MTQETALLSTSPEAAGPERSGAQGLRQDLWLSMNVYDSDRMSMRSRAPGYVATDVLEDADFVGSTPVISANQAAEKVYSELGRLRELKKARRARAARC